MNKLIIGLDFDGTILNSFFRHQKVLYDCISNTETYIHINEIDDLKDYKRVGYNTLSYLKLKNINNADLIFKCWLQNIEKDSYLQLDTLYPDIIYSLQEISKIADLFLVTARTNKSGTLKQITDLEIGQYFLDIFITSAQKKTGYEKYLMTNSIPFNYIIGDTTVDLEWAKNANANFLAVNYGFRSKQWWQQQGHKSYNSLIGALRIIKENKL